MIFGDKRFLEKYDEAVIEKALRIWTIQTDIKFHLQSHWC